MRLCWIKKTLIYLDEILMIIIYLFKFLYLILCRFALSEEDVHQYSRSQRQSKEPPLKFLYILGSKSVQNPFRQQPKQSNLL